MWCGYESYAWKSRPIFKHKDPIQSLTKFFSSATSKTHVPINNHNSWSDNNIDYIFMCCMIVIPVLGSSGFANDILYASCTNWNSLVYLVASLGSFRESYFTTIFTSLETHFLFLLVQFYFLLTSWDYLIAVHKQFWTRTNKNQH